MDNFISNQGCICEEVMVAKHAFNREKKEINLSVFGQEGKTHNKLTNRRNFIMLNDFNLAS